MTPEAPPTEQKIHRMDIFRQRAKEIVEKSMTWAISIDERIQNEQQLAAELADLIKELQQNEVPAFLGALDIIVRAQIKLMYGLQDMDYQRAKFQTMLLVELARRYIAATGGPAQENEGVSSSQAPAVAETAAATHGEAVDAAAI